MRTIMLTAVERLEPRELPTPEPGVGEVVVRVRAASVCGSDVHAFLGHRPGMEPPLVLGHESAGEVAALGVGVAGLAVGQPVAVNPLLSCGECPVCRAGHRNVCPHRQILGIHRPGGFAEYVVIPAQNAFPFPAKVTPALACLAEPVGVALHQLRRLKEGVPPTVAVIGAGFQGLVTIQLARRLGAGWVAVSDVSPERLQIARGLGVDLAIDARTEDAPAAIRAATGGYGAELVVDCAGSTVTRRQAIAACRNAGVVGALGMAEGESALDFVDVIRREITILPTYAYRPEDYGEALGLIASGDLRLAHFVETRRLDEAAEVLRGLASGAGALVKAVLVP